MNPKHSKETQRNLYIFYSFVIGYGLIQGYVQLKAVGIF